MQDCIFCKIANKEIPARVIEENDDVIVFMSLQNHPLIVTKKHIENIYQMDEKLGEAVIRETIRIAKAVKKGLNPDGVNLIQNNEPASGQEVFHFHLHVKPRWHKDLVKLHLDTGIASEDEKKTATDKIKSALV